MKKIFLSLILLYCLAINAQKLNSVYTNGPVKLVADRAYGQQNEWDKIFNLYNDTVKSAWQPNKAIVVAPDGSVFMSHKNRSVIWKFNPDGNFEKRFGSKGSKPGQFVMMPKVECVLGNKCVLTSDVGGHLNIFDFDGKFIKAINLKYMGGSFQPVGNTNVMLLGFAVWKTKSRNMVVNLNIDDGSEKIVYDFFTDYPTIEGKIINTDSLIKAARGHYNLHVPAFNQDNGNDLIILPDGEFIKSDRKTAEYTLFSNTGSEMLKAKMEIDRVKIQQNDVEQNYRILKKTFTENVERYRKMLDSKSASGSKNPDWAVRTERYMNNARTWLDNIELFRDINNYYPYFPPYSNILVDDEGNLLVFEYTSVDDQVSNRFNVIAFNNNGKRLARTSFVCDDYDLTFSRNCFVFSKGYVYAVAKLKNTPGMPLRLIRFRMESSK